MEYTKAKCAFYAGEHKVHIKLIKLTFQCITKMKQITIFVFIVFENSELPHINKNKYDYTSTNNFCALKRNR